MDTWIIGLIIMIIGIVFLAIEIATPAQTFMAIPGTVAVILGILAMVLGDVLFSQFWYAPVIAALIAVPVTVVTVWGYQKLSRGHPPTTTVADSLVGRQGLVTVEVEPDNVKGKVKIGSTMWSATSLEVIPAGERVEVVAAEGVHVKVEKVDNIARWEREQRESEQREV